MDNDDFPDIEGVAMEILTGLLVKMFKAYKKHGLSTPEAAALTAAYAAQVSPDEGTGPQDGS